MMLVLPPGGIPVYGTGLRIIIRGWQLLVPRASEIGNRNRYTHGKKKELLISVCIAKSGTVPAYYVLLCGILMTTVRIN